MILLLEIDGVMLSANSWRSPNILADNFVEFNPKAVKALNIILNENAFDIVLTTSHKFKYNLSQWLDIFSTRNINLSKIDRLPENVNHVDKKNEIVNWFKSKTSSDDFIIIDDDKSLNDLPDFLKSRLIQTSASVGLTDELANEVLERLKKSE